MFHEMTVEKVRLKVEKPRLKYFGKAAGNGLKKYPPCKGVFSTHRPAAVEKETRSQTFSTGRAEMFHGRSGQ